MQCRLKIKLAATHEKITLGVGADVLAFLIDQLGIANRAVIPPFIPGFGFAS